MNKNFKPLLLAMAALGVVGCSDDLSDGAGTSQGEDGNGYIAFTISTVSAGTRAGEGESFTTGTETPPNDHFDTGTEFEICNVDGANCVYFYDASGEYITHSNLSLANADGDADHDYGSSAEEKSYVAHINGDITKVAQCLVILNGDPEKLSGFKNTSLEDALAASQNQTGITDNLGRYIVTTKGDDGSTATTTTYFTMTNSVYVDTKNNKKDVYTTTPIDPLTQICKTEEAAKKNPIRVHVERVVAKFELTYTKVENTNDDIIAPDLDFTKDDNKILVWEKNEDTYEATYYEWGVKVLGWGVNATETDTYWFKNLDKDGALTKTDNNDDWKFGEWSENISNLGYGWNDAARVRSYWAVDPHYDLPASNYPEQYRSATENTNVESGTDGTSYTGLKSDLPLNYYSYNDLKNGDQYKYAPENTFDFTKWSTTPSVTDEDGYAYNDNYFKRTSTHLIVAAELMKKDGNDYKSMGTLYQYDQGYWPAEPTTTEGTTTAATDYSDMPEALQKRMLRMVIYEWETEHGKLYKDANGENELTEEDLDWFIFAPADLKGGDGRVMMKLVMENNSEKTIYEETTSEGQTTYVALAGDQLTKFKEEYLYVYGTARRFNEGAMYYAIPIEHMLKSEKQPEDNGVVRYKYNVGSFGVVRNHWYKVNISAIRKPGTSVDKPDQPIIPNDDPDAEGYVAVEVVIIPWHVINQDVTFE